ncbi:hypothetical protein Tam1G_0008 [Bifidobacterium imperatoris]|uniref:Uncharacterized protein n=1 Tax=Bifidobacterium imperatoris TaxID=2020965 RepID=A0A2N5IV99_9BIFI|nr:hypothetical protein Tam1G_0008 [Bifidobacterium imperatoris]
MYYRLSFAAGSFAAKLLTSPMKSPLDSSLYGSVRGTPQATFASLVRLAHFAYREPAGLSALRLSWLSFAAGSFAAKLLTSPMKSPPDSS